MTSVAVAPPRRSALREFTSSVSTIMAKELRSRFRGRRAFGVLTLYLAVLAAIAYGAYVVVGPDARNQAALGNPFDGSGNLPNASATVGQAIFALLSVFQLLLASLIAPAFTAGAISLEREKQTLDMLVSTPMRPGGIVVGKLLSALAFVVLMIVAAIPISALVLMYGGAKVDDILRQQVVLFTSAIGFGVIGLFYSALIKRTQTATVLTYTTILVLTLGSLLVWRFWTATVENAPGAGIGEVRTAPELLLYPNPAVAMIEVVANTELEYGDFSDALTRLRGGLPLTCDGGVCFPSEPQPFEVPVVPQGGLEGDAVSTRIGQFAVAPQPNRGLIIVSDHFWPRFTISFWALSILLVLVSMRLLAPAGLRLPFRRRPRPPVGAEPAADEVPA